MLISGVFSVNKFVNMLVIAAGVLTCASNASAAPTLVVDAGMLTGATNVLVDGQYYDVSFRDGSCTSLFGGCDANSDFIFDTSAAALLAVNALSDTVFLDVAAGNFDSSPNLTRGCTLTTACSLVVPYRLSGMALVLIADFRNADPNEPDMVRTSNFQRFIGTGSDGARAYAVFTAAANPPPAIPEPASWAMLIAGFGLTGAMARRRRLRAA